MLTLNDFIGQDRIKNNLQIYGKLYLSNKIKQKHILFSGPSGMGKTTLAFLYSKLLNKNIKTLQGPLLISPSDIISVLISMEEGDVLFIDEIHSISRKVEEILYSLMDFNKISIILNKEFSNNVIDIDIPYFTLIGASTEIDKLTKPLITRFDYIGEVEEYTKKQCVDIIIAFFHKYSININDDQLKYILKYVNNVPRTMIKLLTKIYEMDILNNDLNKSINESIEMLNLYPGGLSYYQHKYLIYFKNHDKYCGYKTICNYLNISDNYLFNYIEPFLIKEEYINKTKKGRCLTNKGKNYIHCYKSN